MKKQGISQEMLKIIACVTMLVDHVGAVLLPYEWLRIVGRLAFPIFCFILAEGAHYTKKPQMYALRLGIGALLAEIPFDLIICGMPSWEYQSVMLTLLLGFVMAECINKVKNPLLQILVVVPFALAAELLRTDYGGMGVVLIALFVLTRELPNKLLIQAMGMAAILYLMDTYPVTFGPIQIPIEMFGILALIPIGLYSGRKVTGSKLVQWGFYLFYPVHMLVLYFVRRAIWGF